MVSSLITPFKNLWVYAALILGIAFGLVLYSYVLVEILPPTSRAILLATVLATVLGVVAYYSLLNRWVGPLFPQVAESSRWWIIFGSVLVGGYLAFAYLGGSDGVPSHYITFLLPRQFLRISVPSQPNLDKSQITLVRFTTSLGDVSYGTLQYKGWTRKGTDLVLTDPSNNSLEWTGRTGDTAILTFSSSTQTSIVNVTWNARTEQVSLGSEPDGRYQAVHDFPVPFYAWGTFLLILGALDFIALCCAANLLLWKNRVRILAGLQRSFDALFQAGASGMSDSNQTKGGLSRNEWALVAGLIVLALLLRVFNLNNLYPYADEYAHLLAGKALLHGAPLNSVFDRSLLITTIPMVISERLFGSELWSARLPGTIFNALAILPLYLLAKKINKPVAVVASILYATSPWIIAVARNIREYASYAFYFYWIAYVMVLLLERLPDRLVLFMDWKAFFRPGVRLLSVVLLLVPVYFVFVDARSTFKIIIIAYGAFGLFLLRKLDLKSKSNLISLAALAVGIVLAGIAYAGLGHLSVPLNPHFNAAVIGYFLPGPIQQWYYDRFYVIVALAWIAAGVLCYRTMRTNFVPSFLGTLFLASLIFYVVFFGHYLRPRYLMMVQFWYVIVVALGLYGLFALLLWLPKSEVALPLLSTVLVACTFNVSQSFVPTLYDKQGIMPITEEYHFNIGPAYAYLLGKVSSQDVLLSNFYGGYVKWRGAPTFRKNISYGFITPSVKFWWIFPYEAVDVSPIKPEDFILSVVKGDNSGWIVLDSVTYSASLDRPLPLKTTIAGDKQIEYIGYFGGEYIWRWHTVQPSP